MASLYFEEALLKDGWAARVRLETAGGLRKAPQQVGRIISHWRLAHGAYHL
jgi:hypothetical protein